MNNLHRELAPVSDAAWASIEAEARRTFEQNVAGRRVVDVTGPDGPALASVGTGHLAEIEPTPFRSAATGWPGPGSQPGSAARSSWSSSGCRSR